MSPTAGNQPSLAGRADRPNRVHAVPEDRGVTRLGPVATWEDGPEYAPHERPQYYADAPLPPLEQAPPVERPAAGAPVARPQFDQPSAPVAPLATLVPVPADERDPQRPFDVVTATLTTQSTWGAPDPAQPFVATAPLGGQATSVPATPVPVSPGSFWDAVDQDGSRPSGAVQPVVGPPAGPAPTGTTPTDPYAPYPSPGTPGWFAPPPAAYGDSQQPGRVGARQVVEAATPGLVICLGIGMIIFTLSPIMLLVAVFLSTRVRVAQRAVRTSFRIAAGAVAFFALVGLVRTVVDGDAWWHFVGLWSLLVCWVMLGVLLLVVRQALLRPPPPDPWR